MTRYEFRVDGRLPEAVRDVFAGMRVVDVPPQSVLDGEIRDESQLHGVIAQLQVLGFTVVSVRPVSG